MNLKSSTTFGECVTELTDVQHLGDVGHLMKKNLLKIRTRDTKTF